MGLQFGLNVCPNCLQRERECVREERKGEKRKEKKKKKKKREREREGERGNGMK